MKQIIYIKDLKNHIGQTVSLNGWLYHKRSSGKISFPVLRDGTGYLQGVIVHSQVSEEVLKNFNLLTQESAFKISGLIKEEKRAPGGVEIEVSNIEIISIAEEYPITPKEHGPEFLADRRHLWLRSKRQHAILKIRNTIIHSVRNYFDSNGFICFDGPIFTPAACEGTSTLFECDYFDLGKAYLTQSSQLYAEAGAMAFGKVYTFGPTFRAEKSKTRRHLTEFWMIEPEMAFFDLNDNMDLAEDFLVHIVADVLEKNQEELKILERDLSKLEKIKKPFPRISYDDAVEILKNKGIDFLHGDDFGAPDETAIAEGFDRPIIIHRYPSAVKAFYMKRDPEDESKALAMDILAPDGYGEIVGGSQREDNLELLVGRIKEHNLPMEAFDWYLDLRRFGSVPHSGFGLGLERTVAWICGIEHIREAIPFARMIYRLTP